MPDHFWQYHPSRNARLAPEVYTTIGQPVFFTVRASRDTAPFAQSRLADIAVICLLEQRTKSSCEVVVYCVMPDHLHVVVTPAAEGASSLIFIDRFKGWCSRECGLAGWKSSLWQPRSYDHALRKSEAMEQVAAYILHNPVRRGLVTTLEEYRWAGMPELLFS